MRLVRQPETRTALASSPEHVPLVRALISQTGLAA
jgi:hypothetical protein